MPLSADPFEKAQGAESGRLGRELGNVEADLDVALRAEVVDLVGFHLAKEAVDRRGVGQVAVVEEAGQPCIAQVVDASAMERAHPPDHSVHLVPLLQKEVGEIRPVLARDSSDESFGGHRLRYGRGRKS